MVVDDEPPMRAVVAGELRRRGYEVCEVDRGYVCASKVREGFRGIILMDVMMPVMDGWSTVRTLMKENMLSGNVICMLTGMTDPADQGEGLEEYIIDYLKKPFGGAELAEVVSRAEACLCAE